MTDALELTILIVSYNSRELNLACLASLYADGGGGTDAEVIVWDNASQDGSADAVEEHYGNRVRLVRSDENLGFAGGCNAGVAIANGQWILLLNPDTEVHTDAITNLLAFAKEHPDAGIYGGRTVWPDGTLNIASCWNRSTPWSTFCHAVGLTAVFKRTALFDTEAIGNWQRDSVRRVDIVVGCLMLVRRELWDQLDGFDTTFWMYGEEADFCFRARKLGYHPIITPDATIMHLIGGSSSKRADKVLVLAKARATLIRRHWSALTRWWGIAMMWVWVAVRRVGSVVAARIQPGRRRADADTWRVLWSQRHDWLAGYDRRPRTKQDG